MADRWAAIPTLAVVACLSALSGCQTWEPVPEAERHAWIQRGTSQRRADHPGQFGVRIEARLSVRSSQLTGEFRCVLVADRSNTPRVRVQLYPDLGGKILDLVATDYTLKGFMADGETRLEIVAGSEAPRHFLTLLALTILEWHRPLDTAIITGRRDDSRGRWYRLRTGWPRHGLEQRVTRSGLERRHAYRGVHWVETANVDRRTHSIASDDFELSIDIEHLETEARLPDALFELTLPSPGDAS